MRRASAVTEPTNQLQQAVRQFVPAWIAERSIDLTVTTDASSYAPYDPVTITVEIRNRLPLPIEVATVDRRIWSWAVDGIEEATEERRYVEPVSNTIQFRSSEVKRFATHWDGLIQRVGELDRWTPLSRDEHRISAWIQTATADRLVADDVKIRVE